MKSYTAKTLEDLLQSVAAEKNTTVDQLTYTVTEEKNGFLGFGILSHRHRLRTRRRSRVH